MPVWLNAILAFFGLADKIVTEVHDHNQRVAGANAVVAADLKEANDAQERAAKAAVDVDDKFVDDSLRDGKF